MAVVNELIITPVFLSNAVEVETTFANNILDEEIGGGGGGGGSGWNTVIVSGTTPSITGVENTRYICGEVDTISITPPQSGLIDVRFESGSTPAVLTLPNTVRLPDWFDDSALETNRVYEINIADGEFAAVMSWA